MAIAALLLAGCSGNRPPAQTTVVTVTVADVAPEPTTTVPVQAPSAATAINESEPAPPPGPFVVNRTYSGNWTGGRVLEIAFQAAGSWQMDGWYYQWCNRSNTLKSGLVGGVRSHWISNPGVPGTLGGFSWGGPGGTRVSALGEEKSLGEVTGPHPIYGETKDFYTRVYLTNETLAPSKTGFVRVLAWGVCEADRFWNGTAAFNLQGTFTSLSVSLLNVSVFDFTAMNPEVYVSNYAWAAGRNGILSVHLEKPPHLFSLSLEPVPAVISPELEIREDDRLLRTEAMTAKPGYSELFAGNWTFKIAEFAGASQPLPFFALIEKVGTPLSWKER